MTDYTILDGNGDPQTVTVPTLGRKADTASAPVVLSTQDLAALTPATGLATSALQTTGNTALGTINTTLGSPLQAGGNVVVTGTVPLPTGAATETTLSAQSAKLPASLGAKSGATSLSVVPNTDTAFPISGSLTNISGTISLPTGAATAANQTSVISPLNAATGTATQALNMGAQYLSTLPTFTNAQQGSLTLGSRGALVVQLCGANSANTVQASSSGTDGASNSVAALNVFGYSSVYNGSTWDRTRGDTSGQVNQPYALTGSRIQYSAAASGISNTTTAVTIFASAGGSLRNYVTSLQIATDTLGAATELAIRDGAAGTVIWRTKLQTTSLPLLNITFPVPLKGSAATLLEVVTLTASVTGAVYVSAQGYTAL